jgi:hypothetical protein
MRGTILMWSGDKGVVSADGQRYDFSINEWKGNTAPAANLTVDVAVTNGRPSSVTPVNEADLAKEKMAAMTGKGSEVAKAVYANVGKDVAIAYGVFLFAALFLSVVGANMLGISLKLTNLLSDNMGMMGNGKGTFLVLLATATIAVPYFWKHKFAPLAFFGPALVTVMAFYPLWEQHRQQQQQMEAMGELGQALGQMSQQMGGSPGGLGSLGFGAWIIIAASAYLGFKGVMRFLSRS